MKQSSEQKLKPAEGLCITLPNGNPALQFIAYKDVTVRTYETNNYVRCVVDFEEPFIPKKEADETVHNS